MKQKLYRVLPHLIQCLLISLFNIIAYRKRYRGRYKYFFGEIKKNRSLNLESLKTIQKLRFASFLKSAIDKSLFYKNYPQVSIENIDELPIIDKETLRKNINEIYTLNKSEGIVSKTGGTTGKSLEVIYTYNNIQERFAMLDVFRGEFGYELGKKTAWFSGKSLLTDRDIRKNRFWKTDYLYKVRYYSTFHVSEHFLRFYLEDLINYEPEYFVGFPSTILEIAKYGLTNGYNFPENTVKAIFPTAETVTLEMRNIIESFFKAKMYNQYASSEGAPFIVECKKGNLHLELQSGVFEILGENDMPTSSGRLVVTSFTTEGTPLIRYDIGDSVSLEDENKTCTCGNKNPLVKEILGRIDDYVYSIETGKINLGNVSNTLKDTNGIIRFQVHQNSLDKIELYVVVDGEIYSERVEDKFIQNWRDRIGNKMGLTINYVDEIPVEKSGKYRIVKNNIKHLI